MKHDHNIKLTSENASLSLIGGFLCLPFGQVLFFLSHGKTQKLPSLQMLVLNVAQQWRSAFVSDEGLESTNLALGSIPLHAMLVSHWNRLIVLPNWSSDIPVISRLFIRLGVALGVTPVTLAHLVTSVQGPQGYFRSSGTSGSVGTFRLQGFSLGRQQCSDDPQFQFNWSHFVAKLIFFGSLILCDFPISSSLGLCLFPD